MLTMNRYLISIVGPTAIGKTSLSIFIANHFKAPIISSDSRQFYREMRIGTAVPSEEELSSATHYFIQNRSIQDDYSVGQFEKDALKKLDELFQNHEIVVMVGGSGLYVDAVLKGLHYFPAVNPNIRKELNRRLEREGIQALQNDLKQLDLESYETIELNNPHRLIRALEVCLGSDMPYSYYKNQKIKKRNFTPIKIGLTADRSIVYDRINQRVDLMLKEGLLEEVKGLKKFKQLNALRTVGYTELFHYLDGNWTYDFAIEELKKNTRRFAKRQSTWFRKDIEIKWFDFQSNREAQIRYIKSKMA